MDKKPLLCRLHHHRWEHDHNDEGQGFYLCERCGTTKDEFHMVDSSTFF